MARQFVVREYHEARCVVCPVDPDLEDAMARRLLRTHFCEDSWESGPNADTFEEPGARWTCNCCHAVFTPEQVALLEASAHVVQEDEEPEEPEPWPEPWEAL